MSSDEEREEKELDLTSQDVVTKYKTAAEIVNKALQLVISECKPKAKIVDICEKGDSYIREQSGKNVKTKIERGVAFPTCISINNCVGHFSPLASGESLLEEGDMVKIDMGCHIDGSIAVVAHTHVLHGGAVTGKAADVLAAANTADEVALSPVRPGKKNKDVTEAIQKVAAAYDCKIVEGVLSHQLKQFVIDGNKVVLSISNPETRVDDAEFEENEVSAVDIVTSKGEGKPKLLDEKQTTIYKRAVDKEYMLKMKASRFIFSETSQKVPIMPFSARALEEKRARLGLLECVNHDLLQPYPVLHERPGLFDEMRTRWKGKVAESKARANPMSKIVSNLQTSLIKFEACGLLSGSNILLLLEREQTMLLGRACFGQPINTTEKDKQWIQLGLEEGFYLCHSLKCLQIVNGPKNDQDLWDYLKTRKPAFPYLYKAYLHLRKKNWVVRDGDQYGVDFVAYRHHPTFVHSEFTVIVLPVVDKGVNKRLNVWSDYQCTVRLSRSVGKTLLVLTVDDNNNDGVSPLCMESYTVHERIVTRWSPDQCRESNFSS